MLHFRALLLLLASLVSAPSATAQIAQIPFSGRVTDVTVLTQPPPSMQVSVGDSVFGTVGVDIGAANVIVALGHTTVYSHDDDDLQIVARIGNQIWAAGQAGISSVKDDHPSDGDLLSLGASNLGSALPFAGATNGSLAVRWEDLSAPYNLVRTATLPATSTDFDPSASTSATGAINGGGWLVSFVIETAPVKLISVDDLVPTAPVIHFEVVQPVVAVDVAFAGVAQSLGALSPGMHSVGIQAPATLAPGSHDLVFTSTTSGGSSVATARLNTDYLPKVTACDPWFFFAFNIGLRSVKICPNIELMSWEWELPGARFERLIKCISVTVTSNLVPDATIPGGNPTIHHHLGITAQVGGTSVPLPVVPSIGGGAYWGAAFAADVNLFASRRSVVGFSSVGATSLPGGLSPWNMGIAHQFAVPLR